MTDIPKEAHTLAFDLATRERTETSLQLQAHHYTNAFARFIADVSEKAKAANAELTAASIDTGYPLDAAKKSLSELILPDPESDLLKEAREICAREAEALGFTDTAKEYRSRRYDDDYAMRCTLAALKHRKDG